VLQQAFREGKLSDGLLDPLLDEQDGRGKRRARYNGHTADSVFVKRGVRPEDVVYVVTNIQGTVHLIGRLVVDQVLDQWEQSSSSASHFGTQPIIS